KKALVGLLMSTPKRKPYFFLMELLSVVFVWVSAVSCAIPVNVNTSIIQILMPYFKMCCCFIFYRLCFVNGLNKSNPIVCIVFQCNFYFLVYGFMATGS